MSILQNVMFSFLFPAAGTVLRPSLGRLARPGRLLLLLALPLTPLSTHHTSAQLTPAPPTRDVREVLRLGDAVDVPDWLTFASEPRLMLDASGVTFGAARGNRVWGTGKTEMDIPYIVLYELGPASPDRSSAHSCTDPTPSSSYINPRM